MEKDVIARTETRRQVLPALGRTALLDHHIAETAVAELGEEARKKAPDQP